MNHCKILIEPLFENNLLIKTIKYFKNHPAEHLYVLSTIPTTFRLRAQCKNCSKPINISIENLRIKGVTFSYEQTFSNEGMRIEPGKPCTGKTIYKVVFPLPGLYWLELEIRGKNRLIDIESVQRMLDGKEGRGWSETNKDEEGNPKKNFLRQPILVLDYSQIEQIRLNNLIKSLTILVIIITIIFGILSFV